MAIERLAQGSDQIVFGQLRNSFVMEQRYFVVDKGILIYAKGPGEIARGKHHASLDIGLSVISSKQKRRRIDIDAEEFIYHLKVGLNHNLFI